MAISGHLSPGQVMGEPIIILEQQERKANPLAIRLICRDCQEDPPNIIEENREGMLVCGSCGLVFQQDLIDTRSEWRNFQNDDSGNDDPSRVGEAANPLLNGGQLSSEIAFVGGNAMNRDLQRAQNRNNDDKGNKALLDGYKHIQQLGDSISLTKPVLDFAKALYKRTIESKAFRGKNDMAIIAGCILISCRRNKVGRAFKEIAVLTRVPKKEIGRVFKQLEEFFKKGTPSGVSANGVAITSTAPVEGYTPSTSTTPRELCGRFGTILGLQKPISLIAGSCADLLLSRGMLAGRSPLSVAAVALYIISNLMGFPKSAKEVGTACAVSDGTIRTAWRKIYDDRMSLIQDEWIKKGGKVENLPPM
jgi:transcription initiation factor TFIIB